MKLPPRKRKTAMQSLRKIAAKLRLPFHKTRKPRDTEHKR